MLGQQEPPGVAMLGGVGGSEPASKTLEIRNAAEVESA